MKLKDKSVSNIYQTNNYGNFKIKYGNRPIDKAHVNKLTQSMADEYITRPISVNKRYEIIDGQHRFTAAKALGLPIYYQFASDNLQSIRRMNQNTKNWTLDDFLASYVALEAKDADDTGPYTIFKFFKAYTKFPNAICLMMLTDDRSARNQSFKDGELEIPSGQFELAKKQALLLNQIGQYYDGYKRRSFIVAMLKLFKDEEFKFKHFINKLKLNRSKLFHCTNTDEYIDAIERLYNWGSQNKVRFRRS
ncbi:ParB-like nuclease domain containing protein [uncultured Mediterranean phage uvMED]|nr:ParB-like nuclease domain containing protein [uncultured Mediterranean phage uvMED]BAR17757.1 ParB-like nuclease domain containing protein [uncultured Mediterranean phage uvMED]